MLFAILNHQFYLIYDEQGLQGRDLSCVSKGRIEQDGPFDEKFIRSVSMAPFNKGHACGIFKADLQAGNAERMNTGAGVKVACIRLVFNLDAVRFDL